MARNELEDYDYRPASPPWWPGDERGYADYHKALFTLTSEQSRFVRWKIQSSGMNVARQIAGSRNLGRAAFIAEHGADETAWPLSHPPGVVWHPDIAYAVCLSCWWLDASVNHPDAAAGSARRHAANFGSLDHDGRRRLLDPLPVWERAL